MSGLYRDWWAKQMLLALFLTVCVKEAICMAEWAWALATTGAADGSTCLGCWEVMASDPNGSVHKLVARSFSPCKIISLFY
jgi:hypothetical protein